MRLNMPRSSYLPKSEQLTKITPKHVAAEIYSYESNGAWYAVAFAGKANKPAFHIRFRTPERRAQYVTEWLEGLAKTAEYKAKIKAERKAFRHTLQVGDVLRSSWGYEQTNIDFYEVTALIGEHMVEIRAISQESEDTAYMQGKCVPVPGSYVGKPMRKKVTQYGVKINGYRSASKVEPTIVAGAKVYPTSHWTAYA